MEATIDKTRKKRALVKEITIILSVKLTALYVIWLLFFSHPITDQITNNTMATKILT